MLLLKVLLLALDSRLGSAVGGFCLEAAGANFPLGRMGVATHAPEVMVRGFREMALEVLGPDQPLNEAVQLYGE